MTQQKTTTTTFRNKTAQLYTEWLPLIDNLSNEEAGIIFKNILNYQNGDEIECKNPVWFFILNKLNDYNGNYDEIRGKRVVAGRLGGIAKASKCQQVLANPSKSSNKTKQNKTKQNTYGEFSNVFLSEEEYSKLKVIYQSKLTEGIEKLSNYIATSGKNYKSHYAVLGKHNWVYKQIVGERIDSLEDDELFQSALRSSQL